MSPQTCGGRQRPTGLDSALGSAPPPHVGLCPPAPTRGPGRSDSRTLGKMLGPHFLPAAQTSSCDRGPDLPAGAAGESSVLREAEIGGEGGALPKARPKHLLFPVAGELSARHLSS